MGNQPSGGTPNDMVFAPEYRPRSEIGPEQFEFIQSIGHGSFGEVFQARQKETGELVAIKVLDKARILQANAVERSKQEEHIQNMAGNHPFVVNLRYAFQTERKLCIVLDYVSGGDLFFHVQQAQRFEEPRARLYAAEICVALNYLHSLNIMYRDLKLENVLVDEEGHIRLTDFGLATHLLGGGSGTFEYTFCGTAEYMAPEIVDRRLMKGGGLTFGVDWWTFGVLLYVMICGKYPFHGTTKQKLERKIITGEVVYPADVSMEARDLINKLLAKDPDRRLIREDVKKHPWFREIDWDKVYRKEVVPEVVPKVHMQQGKRDYTVAYSVLDGDRMVHSASVLKPLEGATRLPESDSDEEEEKAFPRRLVRTDEATPPGAPKPEPLETTKSMLQEVGFTLAADAVVPGGPVPATPEAAAAPAAASASASAAPGPVAAAATNGAAKTATTATPTAEARNRSATARKVYVEREVGPKDEEEALYAGDQSTAQNEEQTNAIARCRSVAIKAPEQFVNGWVMVSVNKWNTEQMRVLILSDQALYRVQYDTDPRYQQVEEESITRTALGDLVALHLGKVRDVRSVLSGTRDPSASPVVHGVVVVSQRAGGKIDPTRTYCGAVSPSDYFEWDFKKQKAINENFARNVSEAKYKLTGKYLKIHDCMIRREALKRPKIVLVEEEEEVVKKELVAPWCANPGCMEHLNMIEEVHSQEVYDLRQELKAKTKELEKLQKELTETQEKLQAVTPRVPPRLGFRRGLQNSRNRAATRAVDDLTNKATRVVWHIM